MKVLALATYPVEAAATRYRLQQFVAPLAERGIDLTVDSFLDSQLFTRLYQQKGVAVTALKLFAATVRRLFTVAAARKAKVVLVQREAMMYGPPVIEWIVTQVIRRPMVLDLDDATYVSYTSPTYGSLVKALKWFRKTDDLIRWASLVSCGNRAIAEYVSARGARTQIIPTVVDTEIFRPVVRSAAGGPVVLGWIGTHSTFPYLRSIFGVLERLAKTYDFRLKVVGAGQDEVVVANVQVETLPWKMDREVEDFQSIDIGLYPIDASLYSGKWASGKSGFKAIQYMAVGIPYVATAVGASAELGEPGTTHFFASSEGEWYEALEKLISHPELRAAMGAAGRHHVVANYSLPAQADKLAAVLHSVAEGS